MEVSKTWQMKKDLSAHGFLAAIKNKFQKIQDNVHGDITIADCCMSAMAVFGLKYSSLLKFEEQKTTNKMKQNLNLLYQINNIPCDTYMRERLDVVEPQTLRPAFKKVFAMLQRGKVLESYVYLDGYYMLALDGTGHFSSKSVHCDNCCEKNHKNGTTTYQHQMLCAVIVHPKQKAVIPMAPEPIVKADGSIKNDCERNAGKRLLPQIRKEHPHLKICVVEDALGANAPHIELIKSLDMKFIIGAKPDGNAYLFDAVNHSKCTEYEETDSNGTKRKYKFVNDVPLNDANYELLVNFLEYWEYPVKGNPVHFSWVTDFVINSNNVRLIMEGGRARWHIENQTFNTLKNQGYNYEHNFGHGNKNLCSVFGMIMMLTFLVDQAQAICCN